MFCPEPHWSWGGFLSLLTARGAVLHPGAVWDGQGGSLQGWAPLCRAVCAGDGGWRWEVSPCTDPGALLSGAEHRLKELRSLLRDPLEVSGDLPHLHAFCWPHTALPCPSHCCCSVSGLSLPDLGPGGGCSSSPVLVPMLLSSSGSVKVVGGRFLCRFVFLCMCCWLIVLLAPQE